MTLPLRSVWREVNEPTSPARARARARMFVVSIAVGISSLPFLGELTGADRTGAAGALALALGFGFAAVALVARTRRDLMCGEASISLAVALLVTVLVATRHPWIPGSDHRSVLVPIFGSLALLAALDLVTRARGVASGVEVGVVRAAVSLIAAVANVAALDWIPAGVALVLALLPAAASLPQAARASRRALEAAAFLAAIALFLAPEIEDAVLPRALLITSPTVWAFLHRLAGIALGILTGISVWSPEDEASDPGRVPLS